MSYRILELDVLKVGESKSVQEPLVAQRWEITEEGPFQGLWIWPLEDSDMVHFMGNALGGIGLTDDQMRDVIGMKQQCRAEALGLCE